MARLPENTIKISYEADAVVIEAPGIPTERIPLVYMLDPIPPRETIRREENIGRSRTVNPMKVKEDFGFLNLLDLYCAWKEWGVSYSERDCWTELIKKEFGFFPKI